MSYRLTRLQTFQHCIDPISGPNLQALQTFGRTSFLSPTLKKSHLLSYRNVHSEGYGHIKTSGEPTSGKTIPNELAALRRQSSIESVTHNEPNRPRISQLASLSKCTSTIHRALLYIHKNVRLLKASRPLSIAVSARGRYPSSRAWEHSFKDVFLPNTYGFLPPVNVFSLGRHWAQCFLETLNVDFMKQVWLRMPSKQRTYRWPAIILWSLTVDARLSLLLLESCRAVNDVPFEEVMDCLLYLKRDRGQEVFSDSVCSRLFHSLLLEQFDPTRWSAQRVRKRHISLLLEEASLAQGRKLFNDYIASRSHKTNYSLLAFMDFFTRVGDVDYAINALQHLDPDFRASSRYVLLSLCTNLLKRDSIQHSGSLESFKILPQVLENGIRPNLIIHNLVLMNAFKAGKSHVGWDLFDYLQAQGLHTDARTYLALLQDAIKRKDVPRLNQVLSILHKRHDLTANPFLVAYTINIVRRLYRYNNKALPTEIWSHMLAVYGRVFSLWPLKRLGMVADLETVTTMSDPRQPDPITLGFVVLSYILIQRNPTPVNKLWYWFRRLVETGDPSMVALTRVDLIFNGLVSFYARSPQTLHQAAEVVKYMFETECCEPTAQTWSILMRAFSKHEQDESAEKVKDMMAKKGLQRYDGPWRRYWTIFDSQFTLDDGAYCSWPEIENSFHKSNKPVPEDHAAFAHIYEAGPAAGDPGNEVKPNPHKTVCTSDDVFEEELLRRGPARPISMESGTAGKSHYERLGAAVLGVWQPCKSSMD